MRPEPALMPDPVGPRATPGLRQLTRRPLAVSVMAAASTSEPTTAALARWEALFPQGTTLGNFGEPGEEASQPALVAPAASAPERILDILRFLGLTKTQLKDLCGVSRQTLYDWIGGKFEPEEAKSQRLRELHALALEFAQCAKTPLRAALLTEPVSRGQSLLELLAKPRLESGRLREALHDLAELNARRDARSARGLLERRGHPPVTREAGEENLEQNLRTLEDE